MTVFRRNPPRRAGSEDVSGHPRRDRDIRPMRAARFRSRSWRVLAVADRWRDGAEHQANTTAGEPAAIDKTGKQRGCEAIDKPLYDRLDVRREPRSAKRQGGHGEVATKPKARTKPRKKEVALDQLEVGRSRRDPVHPPARSRARQLSLTRPSRCARSTDGIAPIVGYATSITILPSKDA